MSVCVVGAGPAGLAAARRLSAEGHPLTVVDREARPGGQIGRQPSEGPWAGPYAGIVSQVVDDPAVTVLCGSSVVAIRPASSGFQVIVDCDDSLDVHDVRAVVLATGAREVVTPFPGWHLPGVVTAGALQSLLKRDGGLPWARVGLAGSGPLMMAVAADLHRRGMTPVFHMERRTPTDLLGGGAATVIVRRRMVRELLELRSGRPRRYGWSVIAAEGEERVERVITGSRTRRDVHQVDALAVSSGLVPDVTLARQLGCETAPTANGTGRRVVANVAGATSVPGVFVAGESTGVGGVDKALAEGTVAGLAAAAHLRGSDYEPTSREATAIESGRWFASALDRLFPVDVAWPDRIPGSTLLCRCEEVTLSTVQSAIERGAHGVRAVKGVTRTGMGYCQGRVCGPLVAAALRSRGHEVVDDLESRPLAAPVTLRALGALHPGG